MDEELDPACAPFFSSDPRNTWERCLQEWRRRGRVEDLPKGVRVTKYNPDLGKRLGWAFAEKFPQEHGFVVQRLRSGDPVEGTCAFDVLDMMGEYLLGMTTRGTGEVFPPELLDLKDPIPAQALEEIRSDHLFSEFKGRTVGEWFSYLKKDYDS